MCKYIYIYIYMECISIYLSICLSIYLSIYIYQVEYIVVNKNYGPFYKEKIKTTENLPK